MSDLQSRATKLQFLLTNFRNSIPAKISLAPNRFKTVGNAIFFGDKKREDVPVPALTS
jgi:hypothetical protein